jgi:uncharacterized membrane protein YkoI
MSVSRSFVLAAVVVTLGATTSAQEKRIRRSDLPASVEKTVAAESKGATLRGLSEKKENGKTYYEAELRIDGHSKDVLIDGSGLIVEVEEEVEIDSLPSGVRDGLQAKARNGKLLKVESITKHDRLMAYEAQVMGDGKKFEVQVSADGKSLKREE